MKRVLLGIALLVVAAVLGGCPIYPSQQGEYRVCDSTGCYSCPDTSYSGSCLPYSCGSDADCGNGYICASDGTCVAGSRGTPDAGQTFPDAGDCGQTGCPSGYVCKLSNGAAQCVALGGSDASTGDASDASTAKDGGDSGDASSTAGPCNADGECGGQGARCVDGQCASQGHLCSDTTQCNVAGEACVDGLCEPHCDAGTPCPSGYACDFTRGVCNLNPSACTGSGSSSCQGGSVCVEGHCAPPCTKADGGAGCPAGLVCVNGGCIPGQGASFACLNDGEIGQLATSCPGNAICLHHDCYTACDPDAGGCGVTSADVCKNVTIETGTYSVCSGSSNLGSDCDPAQGKYCSGGNVCIDGFCK
jgi:hypothetical protein